MVIHYCEKIYTFVSFLIMQSVALLYIDCDETDSYYYQHRDESGKLAEDDGEQEEGQETHTYDSSCERQEPSSVTHELKWLLKAFEDGIAIVIYLHCILLFSWIFSDKRWGY